MSRFCVYVQDRIAGIATSAAVRIAEKTIQRKIEFSARHPARTP